MLDKALCEKSYVLPIVKIETLSVWHFSGIDDSSGLCRTFQIMTDTWNSALLFCLWKKDLGKGDLSLSLLLFFTPFIQPQSLEFLSSFLATRLLSSATISPHFFFSRVYQSFLARLSLPPSFLSTPAFFPAPSFCLFQASQSWDFALQHEPQRTLPCNVS